MARALYYPRADRTGQNFGGTSFYAGRTPMARIDGVVWHSTEGSGWPAYDGGSVSPTLTYNPITRAWRQHLPLNVPARALVDTAGGVTTNRQNVVQVELIGTSGWASSENGSAPYRLDGLKVQNYSAANLADLADFARFMNQEWGVPLSAPYAFASWRGGARRMSFAQWNSFAGHCGHQHVPENDHSDPGLLNIGRVLELAQGIIHAADNKPAEEKPKEQEEEDEVTDQISLSALDDGSFYAQTQFGALWIGSMGIVDAILSVQNSRPKRTWNGAAWVITTGPKCLAVERSVYAGVINTIRTEGEAAQAASLARLEQMLEDALKPEEAAE